METTIGAITLEAVRIPPFRELRRHEHASAHLCVVMAGAFEERQPGGGAWCPAGEARLSPPGDVHDLRFAESGARCLLVTVDPRHPLHAELVHPSHRRFLPAARLGDIPERLLALLGARGARGATAALEAELTVLEAFSVEMNGGAAERPGPWLALVRERLHADPRRAPALSELAVLTGRHAVYVARAFRRRFGCSVGGYQRRLRAATAHRLLVGTALPLSHVAALAGYADQAHLTRDLGRRLGRTPATLRREVRGVQDRDAALA